MTPLTPAAVTALAQQAAEPPYDPSCVECRRAAGKDLAGTTWQCVGHVYLERDRLRAALATAQAERSEALAECNCAVLERNAALRRANEQEASAEMAEHDADAQEQRAEQAEAALAQAQVERAPLVALLQECRQRVGDWIVGVGAMESNEDGFDLMHRIEAAVAQPPALPPLPTNWRHTGGPGGEMAGLITYQHIYTRVSVWPSGRVSVHDSSPSADLITVLRHAERAHQELKGGSK
jgi:hypothetical protein